MRRSLAELRAGAYSQAAAQHPPVRNYGDLPSYYCSDAPGWCSGHFPFGREELAIQMSFGCNKEKKMQLIRILSPQIVT